MRVDAMGSAIASAAPRLRFGWADAMTRLRHRHISGVSFEDLGEALSFADEFVDRYGEAAERIGMQPVHLLRPPALGDKSRRGLAWRCNPGMRPIGFQPQLLLMDNGGLAFAYRIESNGDIRLLTGAERSKAIAQAGSAADTFTTIAVPLNLY